MAYVYAYLALAMWAGIAALACYTLGAMFSGNADHLMRTCRWASGVGADPDFWRKRGVR